MTNNSLDKDLALKWEYLTPAERLACPERPDPMLIDILAIMRQLPPQKNAMILRRVKWMIFCGQVEAIWRKLNPFNK